jgi:cytochrome c oxidase assembly factor CtaG/cytochrome c2
MPLVTSDVPTCLPIGALAKVGDVLACRSLGGGGRRAHVRAAGRALLALAIVMTASPGVSAHDGHASALWRWTWDPLAIPLLLISATVYVTGVRRLWRRAGIGVGITRWQAASFAVGLLSVMVALLSPIAWWSEILFSVHMTQHEILMLVSAPLIVMAKPLFVALWTLPARGRERAASLVRGPTIALAWRAITGPLAAFVIHAVAIWIWHIPVLYEAAVVSRPIHLVQHGCFLLSATLFWWGMTHGRYGRVGYGVAVLYVFLTAVHSSVLGALLTVAPGVWYPVYERAAAAWQIDALQDQQLAGLLMWVPSAIVFIVFGLALFAAWLGESERRAALGKIDSVTAVAGRAHQATHTLRSWLIVLLLAILGTSACESRAEQDARTLTGGDPRRGVEAIGRYGCGACHDIPGIRSAKGNVGPSLAHVANRSYLGGQLPNTPANLVRWIQHPQHIERGTAMPEMGVTDADAKDIAAYLYTLR